MEIFTKKKCYPMRMLQNNVYVHKTQYP